MSGWRKLGVIAGGGELPVALAEHLQASGQDYFVARVSPYADSELERHPGATHALGAMGARMDAMRAAGCDALVLIGNVPRQDPSTLDLDAVGLAMVPALLAAAPKGDDALLRAVLEEHEKAGFRVVGAEEAMRDLAAPSGVWGAHKPSATQWDDIRRAAEIASLIGAHDVGQGVVVCDGIVLAVEAQEGTDKMLERVAELPAALRGRDGARKGVLVKRPKPQQERRIDLPTLGVRTMHGASRAGLAGIAVEAGGALALHRDKMTAFADEHDMFLVGFARKDVGEA